MSNNEFGPSVVLGVLLGSITTGLVVHNAHDRFVSATEAIQRRGYDVEALAAEKAEDYWRAVAARRPVADPQPTAEIIGGVK